MANKRKQPAKSASKSASKAKSDKSSPSEPAPKKTKRQIETEAKKLKPGVKDTDFVEEEEKPGKKKKVEKVEESDVAEEPEGEMAEQEEEDEVAGADNGDVHLMPAQRKAKHREVKDEEEEVICRFLEAPVPESEARLKWPYRFAIKEKRKLKSNGASKSSNEEDESDSLIEARCHFRKAEVDGYTYNLEDDAYVQAGEGQANYIGKIVEMFEGIDGVPYFRAQWFYRARDTVIQEEHESLIYEKRVFFSVVQDDNFLDCLVKPLVIARLQPNVDIKRKEEEMNFDYYYDMMYHLPHCSFVSLEQDIPEGDVSETGSTISSDVEGGLAAVSGAEGKEEENTEMTLLDIYAGCGAMSTGLTLGANSAGVKLVTKWALDLNKYACESLKWNHPETKVFNGFAHDYLSLLKEWQKLCASFSLVQGPGHELINLDSESDSGDENEDDQDDEDDSNDSEVYEVEEIYDICYGDPKECDKVGLYFKVKWKGYGPTYDTWEPIDGLSGCQQKIKDFVTNGHENKILPLPGMVDVICGGPPCQGISGFNRFRDKLQPLKDEKNKQLIVFMDIVQFLKPRFVLMENVVDLFKFASAYLGRYAFARLVAMNYQARFGLMAAGAYGLAQFRMRAFLWASLPSERLPQYPLPTHDVVVRGNVPVEFESCFVAYEAGQTPELEDKLFLEAVISDLPPVENGEKRDERPYTNEPDSEFQQFIRLGKHEMPGSTSSKPELSSPLLYDHRPLCLNEDDYARVRRIPRRKGANFRDLPGLKIGADNKVELDPEVERELLPSGKPLVPDYAISFVRGTSTKPFGRLWWDETVPTVVGRAEPHNQVILHPEQDRVLTIRENARLQGFPDYYKLSGPVKERYIQVGNAVAVPVARALGHSLALALKGNSGTKPTFRLPQGYPFLNEGNLEVPE
ncbi:OLC1v1006030C1 [Oldenlandia corymbosa var. corymbosa]|uniref:DNA (cytosine-5-)-methyltransferase n=1 Tax=Oldenlandia corymbosa var. corymbosa TaxID=529605 RepID=A0AAV1DG27_OLDCO|nr:OLC1v1006030C1 [Oldenlandia corymbosa var. corymbosa]